MHARAEMSSRWCGVVVRRGGTSSGVVHVTLPWFKIKWSVAKSLRVAEQCDVNIHSFTHSLTVPAVVDGFFGCENRRHVYHTVMWHPRSHRVTNPDCMVSVLKFLNGCFEVALVFSGRWTLSGDFADIIMDIRYRLTSFSNPFYANRAQTFDLNSARHRLRIFVDRCTHKTYLLQSETKLPRVVPIWTHLLYGTILLPISFLYH
ncbi:uncharacterized protein TNCV_1001341 [Trichonephila clavipes]|nr:uncharacterized protein TNCV_1001341 [Trichonephila clavipes]